MQIRLSLFLLPAALCGAANLAAQAPRPLPELQTGPVPWTNGLSGLSERLAAIGLPEMPKEEFVQHIHQLLHITVRGAPVTVPAGIGINQLARYISPIHTHDTTGVIHIESATQDKFTLGQFFDVWGVRFTGKCLGGYCSRAADSLRVTVNGARVPGDPRSVPLVDHEEIGISYGPVPARRQADKRIGG